MIGVGEPDRTADNGVKAVIRGLDGMVHESAKEWFCDRHHTR